MILTDEPNNRFLCDVPMCGKVTHSIIGYDELHPSNNLHFCENCQEELFKAIEARRKKNGK